MKIRSVLCLLCMCTLLAGAKPLHITGSEQHQEKEIGAVASFDTLHISGQTEVDFKQGDSYYVSVYGPENLVEHLQIESEKGILSISYQQPLHILGDHHVRILVTAPNLTRVEMHEQGELELVGPVSFKELTIWADGRTEVDIERLEADSVRIETKGEAEVDFKDLTCQTLHVRATEHSSVESQQTHCQAATGIGDNRAEITLLGVQAKMVTMQSHQASQIELKGQTENASLTAQGRSSIQAGSLQANQAAVMAANGAYIDVRVSDRLDAQTESKGVVKYRGWPKEINRSGKGLVRKNS